RRRRIGEHQAIQVFAASTLAAPGVNQFQRQTGEGQTEFDPLDAVRRTPSGIRPDPAPGTQRQARLLRLEFVMTPAARRTRSPQQLLARKRRQVLQRAATKRAREFPVEPQLPPLTEPCARTDERMVAACHEQTRRRLDFKGGEIGIPIRPLDPSLLHQHRKIAENNLIKEYAIKFALAESGSQSKLAG